jgi:hypothetical protein
MIVTSESSEPLASATTSPFALQPQTCGLLPQRLPVSQETSMPGRGILSQLRGPEDDLMKDNIGFNSNFRGMER